MEKKDTKLDIEKMQIFFRNFVKEREWNQFHTPKNLCIALSVEASELMEIFQWLTPKESLEATQDSEKKQAISDEIADIFSYLIRLADILNIDLEKAFWDKFKQNTEKYPIELSKGNHIKYDKLKK